MELSIQLSNIFVILLALKQGNYGAKQNDGCMKKTNSNLRVSDIHKIFGGDRKKSTVGKAILATKKIIYNNKDWERPFDINDVKKAFYPLQCLEIYQA